MDFAFSEEQEMLRAAARSWLKAQYPADRMVSAADSERGWDPRSWQELDSLGWLDPGLGMLEYAVLAEEAGYALYAGPWWSTAALAAPVLGAMPDQPTTLAWAEPGTPDLRSAGRSSTMTATRAGEAWELTGSKLRVPDLAIADSVLVVAGAEGGSGIWQTQLPEHGVTPLSTMDTTRRLAGLRLDSAAATMVIEPGEASDVLVRVRRRSVALLSCEAVGIAQRALDLCSAHAKERIQFGRPIGSYQGVSHRVADVYTALQLSRSLAYWAAWAVDADAPDVDHAVTVAAVSAGEGAVRACESAIQVMGGIGFTWDHPVHRSYKRAQWIAAFDGTARSRRAEVAAALLD
ncbi:MAG: acyl-CoA/acyl-ACP dehydrogenase [Geodermatophilaceae bacterium]|nr:acyl-CoA/acyl-ACP dehydrogenase [Geodermatophilaceae bacterium]